MFWLFSAALASPEEFHAAIGRMQAAVAQVDDATFVLHQREYVNGRWGETVSMRVRYRPPNTVYVEWDSGQRMLWDPSRYEKMRVDPPYLPAMWLSPGSALARRGQRHTVHRMGLAPVVALFGPDIERIQANEALRPTVTMSSPSLYGRSARCYDANMRKDLEPALYAYRVEVCLDAETWLPLRMRSWDIEDGELRQVEEYAYQDLRVNVGLKDEDFDLGVLDL